MTSNFDRMALNTYDRDELFGFFMGMVYDRVLTKLNLRTILKAAAPYTHIRKKCI